MPAGLAGIVICTLLHKTYHIQYTNESGLLPGSYLPESYSAANSLFPLSIAKEFFVFVRIIEQDIYLNCLMLYLRYKSFLQVICSLA